MKNLYKSLVLTFAILGFCTLTSKAVNINAGGIISSNTTWNADTVKVTGNITVNNGITLTVNAGTYVQFQGHYKLYVQGRILAQGTATNKITFTALNSSTGWSGIRFYNTPLTNDTSKFEYCIVSYAKANAGDTYDKRGGGFLFYNFSKAIVRNSIISNNYASYQGGGIACWTNSSPKLINNIICNNTAPSLGGGIFIYSGSSPDVINNTIVNNSGGSQGGGVIAYSSTCHPNIINCIIWGNTANNSPQVGNSTYPIVSNCNIQGGFAGIGNIDTLPAFVSPSTGVGYTFNGLTADWSLQSTSPCRNAGIYPSGYGVSMFDVMGNFRYDEGTIDIGALEYVASTQVCGTINTNTTWSGNVLITCNVLVGNGKTLTIEPGTEVKFLGKFHLDIDGRLLAVGTQDSMITFTCHNPNEGWYGIDFVSTSASNDTSKIEYCVIKNGKASGSINQDRYGGAIYISSFSKLIIRSNIISNNWSYYYGGGIYCNYSSAKIINNVIVNNTSNHNYGGGIYLNGSSSYTPWIINNTIAKNTSTSRGGGIYRGYSALPVIKNNILWGNQASYSGTNKQIYPTSISNVQYCDIEGGTYSGTGNISSDPKFKNPSWGAGSGYIGYNRNWSLKSTSPCIDAGTPSAVGLELPPIDLLGKTRVYSTAVDIGAYEDKSSLTASCNITSNTTWDANTVNITCNVTVANGVKLTILPGVKVKFNGSYSLTINGSLYAVGTETDTIRFTTDNPSVGWKGIRIYNPPNSNDSTIIHNCRIELSISGSAVYIYSFDKVRVSNCLIKNNSYTSGTGGGLYLSSTNCIIKNNVIKNNTAREGAGINCNSFNGTINNNVIKYNTASYRGGGLRFTSSAATITNNLIANNKTTYTGNVYYRGGGGIFYMNYEVSTFINNIIVNNQSGYYGGGINIYSDAKPEFYNNTIANNYSSQYGGGLITSSNSDPIFKNNIFYNNSAGNFLGGNEVNLYDVASDPKFYNCLIKGGTLDFRGTGSLLNYNGVYNDNLDNDPLFNNPSSGSGVAYDGLAANWYIDSLSPCINSGLSDVSGLGLTSTDYAGNPRINKGRIDIGAYENQEDIYAQCNIVSNTIWEADTIKVNCDVTVENNVTLTISPGTYVEFQGPYKLNIQGRLLAIGNSNKQITFAVKDTSGFADMTSTNGGWNGIEFNSTPNTNDTSKIVFCVIKYGKAKESSTSASVGGGLYIYNYSKVIIANSIITNNRAYYKGGGIYIESSNPIIKNSIICNNSAKGYGNPYGGGIYMDDAYPKIYNNTISYNYCKRYGGGIYCTTSSPLFKNNIIYQNQGYYSNYSSYNEEVRIQPGSNPSFYNNNIMGGKNKIYGYQYISTYQDNIDNDPIFITPPDSMGAKYDGFSANWDLDQNSPCINAGTIAGINPGGEDFVGNDRIVGDTIDIGHFEIQLSNRFITTQPVAQTACLGTSASFNVVIGVPSNYQWQKNGTDINGETGTTLTINNVALVDTGNYSCLFSNDFGSVTSDVVSLTVQTPPQITMNPTSASRCLGDSVTFKVEAEGTQPITYQWQNTSGNLQGSAPMAYYTVGSANTINTGTSYPAPYGNYWWGAKHQFIILASELSAAGISTGDIQSLAFDVTNANNCPPLDNFTLQIGFTTNNALTSTWESGLTTVYTNTSYQPTVGWNTHTFQTPITWDGTSNLIIETCFNNSSYLYNGNASISLTTTTYNSTHESHADIATVCSNPNNNYLHAKRPVVKILAGSEVSNYYINSISQNDATTYKCEASNVCGSQLSTGAILTIKTPPSVSSLPGTYTLCETNPIPLSVNATGDPTPTYQWYKDSTIMTGYTTQQLSISAASASDQGDYYCKATNICGNDSTNISSVIVNEEPDITSQSSSSAVCENQSLTLSATASGAQPLTYQWYKNSISITGATNNTYTISSVSTSDAATYFCRATNSCGYDESSGIVITVKTAPSLTAQSSSTSVCQGSSQIFSVTASGTATIIYQWYKNSNAIGSATNNSYSANTAGNYYCIATNTCGNITSNTMTLTINTSPTITSHPSNSTQCEGSGASFNITASGTSPITYQWYDGSGIISGATNNSYLISPVVTTDAGTYYCKATNTCGNANSNTANLTVNMAPTITAQSSDATVCSGNANVFSITATGSGTLTYQWYNSSGAIGSATNNSYSATVAGNYYCKVTNSCGNATSNTLLLTINTSPAITSHPSNISQCEGLGASFSVNASGSSPITYQWYDGSGAITGATNNTYLISPVSQSDAGTYYCKATNSCGNINTNTATLTVTVAPTITAQSNSASVCSGSSNTFSVTATGSGTLSYQWYNNSGAIVSATNNTYSATTANNYYCKVTNSCGSATSNTMILTVNTSPTISSHPSSTTQCVGSGANFSVTAGGTSPITYQWYDGSGAITGATNSSYLISPVASTHAGTYYCKATNSCGNINSNTANLTVTVAPSITTQTSSTSVCSGSSNLFSVTASGTAPISYQWYNSSGAIGSATNNSYSANSANNYYCIVTNSCGSVTSNTMTLTVNTAPTISSHPSSTTKCEGSGASFNITANGTSPITYQWYDGSGAISGATNSSYLISPVSSSDAGTYYCKATNSCGNINSNTANLTVTVAPSITTQTSSTSVCSGSSNLFSVTASGTAPISYQWYNSSGAISSATNNSYSASSAENYYCKVSNSCGNTTSNTMTLTVNTAPTISSHPSSTTKCEGSGASFNITASGTSPITYQWYNVSGAISGAINSSYLISPVSSSDAGTYYCKATNSCGNINSNTANLTVTVAPSITTQTSSTSICSGSSNLFSVTASGTAPISYQWYNSSGAISSATNNSYSVSSAENYYCKVSNSCGNTTSNTMTLTVNTAPTISSHPSSTTKCEGSGASFNITASGTSPITYQWYDGSGAISGAINSSYLISPVSSSDAGTYYCKATNSCGNINSNTANLTVTVAPSITTQTSSTSICSGSSNLFSVTASGTAPISYQWYNNSSAISSATNNTYSANSANNYYCIVTNSCGSITSNTMTLTVNTAPAISSHPSSTTICEGSGASFNVTASGTSPITYQWYDGSGSISGATNSSYLISPVSSSDAGTYYCNAINSCGNLNSNTANLTVTVAPSISAQSNSTSVCTGSSNLFYITASGTPTPTYQWYDANGAISSATNNTYSANSAGNYYCIATNSCGNATSNTMALSIISSSNITTQPSNSIKCEGQSAQFNIAASGTSPITYQWYDGSGAITGATNNSYLISPVSASDAGNYYCKATNTCGNQNSNTAALTVNSTVSITSQSGDSTKCSGSDMHFSITATGTAPITYQWYNNNGSIFGATSNSYTKSNISSADDGGYYCVATNNCGYATSITKNLSVISLPTIASQSGNDTVCVGQSATFSITASGTQPLSYQWYKSSSAINNATNNTYTISSVTANDAGSYYCEVTNSCSSINSTSVSLLVNIPVSIVSQTGDSTKCAGDNMQFGITTTGTTPITYQWNNNNGSIFGATSNTYTKYSVSNADAGSYYCVASNLCGNTQSSNKVLTVNTAPIISSQTTNTTLCEGLGMTFNVNTTGTSPLTYQWYKGTTAITAATGSSYSISSVASPDSGIYHCVVSNSCGTIIGSNITLVVNALPAITNQTSSSTKCSGQTMVFSITATGTTPLTYQWFFNGDTILNATNNTYNISTVDTSHVGIYYCVVTNSCGTTQSNNISLTVNEAPAITSQSGNDIKCVGQSMTFNVTASGTAPLTYQWYDNSGLITGATNNIYILNSVDTSDAGTYYCIVTNSCGTAQSTSKILTINSPATITSQSSGATKCEGENMVFTITVSGTSLIMYQWYDNSGLITGATNSSYTINSITAANSGSYYCIATNSCGSDASNLIILTVNTAPVVTQQSQNTTICSGQNVVFTTTTSGTSPITYQWYYNNAQISGATNGIYIIPSVDTADAGNYYCKATNLCGADSTTNISLTVNSPITINYQSGDSSRCDGKSMTFSVQANGTLPITYQWFDASGAITGAINNTYVIDTITISDAGYYYCVLTNTCGSAQTTYKTLTVHALPVVDIGNDTTFCDGGSVTLSPGIGYTTIWNTGSFNPQLNVTVSGSYWCSVIDQYGCSAMSDTVIVSVSLPYANDEICIVGVDSATQKNIILWEKTPNVGIVSYNLYKESTVSGVYNLITNKDADSLSTFIDLSSTPIAKPSRYTITAIDTCGNESPFSNPHATMHLTVNSGMGGAWNLIWSKYEGFSVATYRIWRADTTLNWALIDSVQGSFFTFVDASPPSGGLFYQIEIVKPGPPCNPTAKGSKVNTNYNSSRSNQADNGLIIAPSISTDFIGIPTTGNAPLQVQFYDESSGVPTIWSWKFGDGAVSSMQNPIHVYDSLGTYNVILTASNNDGSNSIAKMGYITVTNIGISEYTKNCEISIYPNPYKNYTNVNYKIFNEVDVKIDVYNMLGKKISTLVDERQTVGTYKYQFSAKDLGYSTGIYYLRFTIGKQMFTKKLIEVN